MTSKIARDAKREGRKADEIQRSQEDIKAYEEALKESQLAKAGVAAVESDEESVGLVEDTTDIIDEEVVEEKKEEKEEKGLDLDF